LALFGLGTGQQRLQVGGPASASSGPGLLQCCCSWIRCSAVQTAAPSAAPSELSPYSFSFGCVCWLVQVVAAARQWRQAAARVGGRSAPGWWQQTQHKATHALGPADAGVHCRVKYKVQLLIVHMGWQAGPVPSVAPTASAWRQVLQYISLNMSRVLVCAVVVLWPPLLAHHSCSPSIRLCQVVFKPTLQHACRARMRDGSLAFRGCVTCWVSMLTP
jgi:hypothetical protein